MQALAAHRSSSHLRRDARAKATASVVIDAHVHARSVTWGEVDVSFFPQRGYGAPRQWATVKCPRGYSTMPLLPEGR